MKLGCLRRITLALGAATVTLLAACATPPTSQIPQSQFCVPLVSYKPSQSEEFLNVGASSKVQ